MDAYKPMNRPAREAGFTLLEVLISILLTVIGLLGLAGMQAFAHQAELESYQRAQALILLNDIVDRINANRRSAGCFAFTTDTANGTPWIGDATAPGGGGAALGTSNCPSGFENSITKAAVDGAVNELDGILKGVAETKGGVQVGAMIGARACVSLTGGVYTVVVTWQGMSEGFTPVVSCANNQYGSETRRRAVWTTLRIATLG